MAFRLAARSRLSVSSFSNASSSFLPSVPSPLPSSSLTLNLTFRRTLVNRALTKPVPPKTETIRTPTDFLTQIGRSMDSKLSSYVPESVTWDEFWRNLASGLEMRKAGVEVHNRRYTLWCMSKFRRGIPVEEFAHEEKPKKTVRGWGPAVQNGKRIRSKRKHLKLKRK